MKVNLVAVPGVSRTWDDPYLEGDLAKAGFLAANILKYLSMGDANQQSRSIQNLVGQTPAIKDLLASNTLDKELFCALVAEYVVDQSLGYEESEFLAFPVPYEVVENVMKDLIGEEASPLKSSE